MSKSINKKDMFATVAGWYGALAIMLAYVLVSFEFISAQAITYQVLNLTGAIGIIIISAHKNILSTEILNIFWVIIAAFALFRLLA